LIHRPTVTKDFLKCPMYWRLKQLWQPKAGEWTPYKLMGTAIHAGVHEFWLSRDLVKAAQVAQEVLGANFVDQPIWTQEGCSKLVSKGLLEALQGTPGHVMWSQTEDLVGSELDLGHCHPDLVTRSKVTGQLFVTDLKTSYVVKPQWVSKRLLSYETDWQFHHYAWAVGEKYGEPVEAVRVQLVALSPKVTSWVYPVKLSQARLKNWLETAKSVWINLDQVKNRIEKYPAPIGGSFHPIQNLTSCDQYGGCEFKTACHTLELEEKTFASFYDPIPSNPVDDPPADDDY
jgi:hypothetical protein